MYGDYTGFELGELVLRSARKSPSARQFSNWADVGRFGKARKNSKIVC